MIRGYRVWDNQEKTYSDKAFSIDQFGLCYVQDEDGYWEEIDDSRFIVEFETGLQDKNGKEIYKGDIVKMTCRVDKNQSTLYKVVWDDFLTGYDLINLERSKEDVGYLTKPNVKKCFKIIGNIHENPELVGVEK